MRSEKHQIARVWMMRNGEGTANASLISAAPDLLEALRDLEREFRAVFPIYYYSEPWAHDKNEKLAAARAAIQRATEEA